MLLNDSVTVAVEVPIYLTREDLAYYRSRGFTLDFDADVITGHIDFLQIRNGYLHVLDYKPEAKKEKHAQHGAPRNSLSRFRGPEVRSLVAPLPGSADLMQKNDDLDYWEHKLEQNWQHSLPACLLSFDRAGLAPAGFLQEVSPSHLWFPLFQVFVARSLRCPHFVSKSFTCSWYWPITVVASFISM
jgi:hypothetical protein